MRKRDIFICASLFLLTSCGSVPLTGRKQLLLVSDSEVLSSSLTQYNDYIKTAKKSTSSSQTAMVKRVGQKIAKATEEYLRVGRDQELFLGIQSCSRQTGQCVLYAWWKNCGLRGPNESGNFRRRTGSSHWT